MGCLKVDIRQLQSDLSASFERIGGASASVCLLMNGIFDVLKAVVYLISGLFVSIGIVDTKFKSDIRCVSPVPSVSVSLVCDVGLDTEYYLQVFEGNLITIDGCFIKVLKG